LKINSAKGEEAAKVSEKNVKKKIKEKFKRLLVAVARPRKTLPTTHM